MSDLNERLMQCRGRIRATEKLEALLAAACRSHEHQASEHHRLQDVMTQEKIDVQRLEGLSLQALFFSVLGSRDARLDKEREEYLAAKLRFDAAARALTEEGDAVRHLEERLAALGDARADYAALLQEKRTYLESAGDARSEQLFAHSERVADLASDGKELAEAIHAGDAALASLRDVAGDLSSAKGWGTVDLLGGGILSTMAKRSKMDSAQKKALHAQERLRRFNDELADLGRRIELSLEIGGFLGFADYFFDGLIADWHVQSKIKKAIEACDQAVDRVSSGVGSCRTKLTETERDLEHARRERAAFIEGA